MYSEHNSVVGELTQTVRHSDTQNSHTLTLTFSLTNTLTLTDSLSKTNRNIVDILLYTVIR